MFFIPQEALRIDLDFCYNKTAAKLHCVFWTPNWSLFAEVEIAEMRLLWLHRNTPNGFTLFVAYKTAAKLLCTFEIQKPITPLNSKWPNLTLQYAVEKCKHRQWLVLSLKLRLASMFVPEVLNHTFPHDNLLLSDSESPSSWGHAGIELKWFWARVWL